MSVGQWLWGLGNFCPWFICMHMDPHIKIDIVLQPNFVGLNKIQNCGKEDLK